MLATLCLVAQVAAGSVAWAVDGPASAAAADPVLVGAGGIASCDSPGDEATAALLDAMPGATVFTAGDNAYEKGTASQFAKCYDKTWGRFKSRTHPAPGNHDYSAASGGSGGPYYAYFGAAAGNCVELVADDAVIGHPRSRFFGTPTTMLWVYRLGLERAKQYLLTGCEIDAPTALRIGLVSEVHRRRPSWRNGSRSTPAASGTSPPTSWPSTSC